MAIPAIVTTIGAANANSYLSLEDADAYFDQRLGVTAWQDAPADDRARALLMAARRLENENWLGSRASSTQSLAWPRSEAEQYLTTEIPQPVTDAQCEIALSLLVNGAAPGAGSSRVKRFTADGLTVEREFSSVIGSLPDEVLALIGGLTAGNKLRRA